MPPAPAPAKPLTHNQRIVLAALKKADAPLTVYQILALRAVSNKGLRAPLTIYRALERLLALGLVHRIERLNAYVACEHAPHDSAVGFAICTDCRRVVELPLAACEKHLASTARRSGFQVEALQVEMVGRCPRCSAGEEDSQG